MAGRGNPLVKLIEEEEEEKRIDNKIYRDAETSFYETIKIAGQNLDDSLLEEAGNVVDMVTSPIETGKAILHVLSGYLQKALPEEADSFLPEGWQNDELYAEAVNEFYKDRYGSWEGFKDTLAENPVSILADAYIAKGILSGVTKVGGKIVKPSQKQTNVQKGRGEDGTLLTTQQRYDALMKEKGPDGSMINAEVAAMAEKNPALKTTIMDNIAQAVKAGEAVKNKKATVIADNKVVSTAALETASLGKIARNEAMLSQYPLRNKSQQAAAAKKRADMDEAYVYGTARKDAGDMYAQPVATAGMVTSKARLPKPVSEAGKSGKHERMRNLLNENWQSRTAKSVLSASKVGNIGEELNKALAKDANYPLIPDSGLPDYELDLTPAAKIPVIEEKEEVQERRPGWMQGNTYADNDGSFWSADFDDEHWNTPAGVQEAINIWGRPMGSRHSWETPLGTKSQYANRQQPDWSWMNQYD